MAQVTVTVDLINEVLSNCPLVFVQHEVGSKFTVYQDGKEVKGVRSIIIRAEHDSFTTHEIEYLTGATSDDAEN